MQSVLHHVARLLLRQYQRQEEEKAVGDVKLINVSTLRLRPLSAGDAVKTNYLYEVV